MQGKEWSGVKGEKIRGVGVGALGWRQCERRGTKGEVRDRLMCDFGGGVGKG